MAISKGEPKAAQHAVETNWRNAATRLSAVIEEFGERGIWHLWDAESASANGGAPGKSPRPR